MSYFEQYKFISSQDVASLVKLELRSYFDSGAVDDILFPRWIEDAMSKLELGGFQINDTILHADNHYAILPDDFYAARECWLLVDYPGFYIDSPTAVYENYISNIVKMTDLPPAQPSLASCEDQDCPPDLIRAIYKIHDTSYVKGYKRSILLKPGRISKFNNPRYHYVNTMSYGEDSFDVHGNRLVLTVRKGVIYLVYYSYLKDEDGYPMIPDIFRVRKYIESYLKYKIFEFLSNQVIDETTKIIFTKLQMYKQESDEAFIIAANELKKESLYDVVRKIENSYKFGDSARIYEVMVYGRRTHG